MPEIKKGERKNKYISRCVKFVIDKEGKTQDQALGKCYGMWKNKKESHIENFETFMNENLKKILNNDIKKMKRKQQLDANVNLGTRVIPDKTKKIPPKKITRKEIDESN